MVASYATLANLKVRLRITESSYDAELQDMLDDASAVIDNETHRTFRACASETRYFDGGDKSVVLIDDLILPSAVEIDGEEVDDDDYEFWPYQKQYLDTGKLLAEWPFIELRYISSDSIWPQGVRNIAITGTWGFPTVPRQIERACLVFAVKFWYQMGEEIFQNDRAAQHGFTGFGPDNVQKADLRLLGDFVRNQA